MRPPASTPQMVKKKFYCHPNVNTGINIEYYKSVWFKNLAHLFDSRNFSLCKMLNGGYYN